MPLNDAANRLFQGFSKLSRKERYARLIEMGALTKEETQFLTTGGTKDISLAEKFIENVIGYFQLPLGVATHFKIDNRDYIIPMAVEETSIIAALSKTAKWIRQTGKITTSIEGNTIIGQLQIAKVKDYTLLQETLNKNKNFLIEQVNQNIASGLVKRGGGVQDISLRQIQRHDDHLMAVIHVFVDCCDAMGANILNQILEYLKNPIEHLTGEQVAMCILSNLNDHKLTLATVKINKINPLLGKRLQEASLFAEYDAYRAATHNKGVLNGIDPILIATGNDWRAVEAGIHAYATREGRYQAITRWRFDGQTLTGEFKAPVIVGIVGGVTQLPPHS